MAFADDIRDLYESPAGSELCSRSSADLEAARAEMELLRGAHQEVRAVMNRVFGAFQEDLSAGRERRNQVIHFAGLLDRIIQENLGPGDHRSLSALHIRDELDASFASIAERFGVDPAELESMVQQSFETVEPGRVDQLFQALEAEEAVVFQQRAQAFSTVAQNLLGEQQSRFEDREEVYETASHHVYVSQVEYDGRPDAQIITLEALTVPKTAVVQRHGSDAVPGLFFLTLNLQTGEFSSENLLSNYGKSATTDELRSLCEAVFRTFTGSGPTSLSSDGGGEDAPSLIPHFKMRSGQPVLAIGRTCIGDMLFRALLSSNQVNDVHSFMTFIEGLQGVNQLLFEEAVDHQHNLDLEHFPVALDRKRSRNGVRLTTDERSSLALAARLIRLHLLVQAVAAIADANTAQMSAEEYQTAVQWALQTNPQFVEVAHQLGMAA